MSVRCKGETGRKQVLRTTRCHPLLATAQDPRQTGNLEHGWHPGRAYGCLPLPVISIGPISRLPYRGKRWFSRKCSPTSGDDWS